MPSKIRDIVMIPAWLVVAVLVLVLLGVVALGEYAFNTDHAAFPGR